MRISIAIMACLILAASAAAQERTVTITPIDGTVDGTLPDATAGVCIFGNPGTPTWAIVGPLTQSPTSSPSKVLSMTLPTPSATTGAPRGMVG